MDTLLAPVNPWRIELIAVLHASHSSGERKSLTLDVERGFLLRLRKGVYVDRTAFKELTPEEQHIVLLRAFAVASRLRPRLSVRGVQRGGSPTRSPSRMRVSSPRRSRAAGSR